MVSGHATLLAVNVGNTRTALGRFQGGRLAESTSLVNTDRGAIVREAGAMVGRNESGERMPIVVGSVNAAVSEPLSSELDDLDVTEVRRAGAGDLVIPIGRQLDPESIVGVDRLLNAAAAYAMLKQACVLIDAGTAVTVDFVDGAGTFHGGAILPGFRMQLRALHEGTALLPELSPGRPAEGEFFGANTASAMLHGVYYGIRGAVRLLIERYAEAYQAYPLILATGGDAHLLFDDDELIERVVDDLALQGLRVTWEFALDPSEFES